MDDKNINLKVCMLIATYYPVWGGAQKQLKQICTYLDKLKVSNFVLTRRVKNAKKEERIEGLFVRRIFVTNAFKVIDSISFVVFSLLWLLKNSSRFNIIHCYQIYSPTTIGVLAKIFLPNKKVIVKVTSSNEYGEVNEIKKLPFIKFRLWLLGHVDKFVVVNNKSKEELLSLGIPQAKIEYLPNGVFVSEEGIFNKEEKIRKRKLLKLDYEKIVIFTGRITQEKNLSILLYAWKDVVKKYKNVHLIILGEGGKERSTIEDTFSLRKTLNLEGNVHLCGRVDNVSDYLAASDIFVLPSISEGLSNSLLEAMSKGLGIVASNNDGNRQVIKHGENGILIDANKKEEISSALLKLLEDEQLSLNLGKNAYRLIKNNFDIENIARNYKELYLRLLTKTHD